MFTVSGIGLMMDSVYTYITRQLTYHRCSLLAHISFDELMISGSLLHNGTVDRHGFLGTCQSLASTLPSTNF